MRTHPDVSLADSVSAIPKFPIVPSPRTKGGSRLRLLGPVWSIATFRASGRQGWLRVVVGSA